jgi:hypothetical protein
MSLEARLSKIEKAHYRALHFFKQLYYNSRGYEERCKVCNHDKVEKIEELRRKGLSYAKILERLDLKNDMSVMSLQRHFTRHYPRKLEHMKLQADEEKETLTEVINDYPFLADVLLADDTYDRDIFLSSYGYCLTGNCLCRQVPMKKVMNSIEARNTANQSYRREITYYDTIGFSNDGVIAKSIANCLECELQKTRYTNERLFELLIKRSFKNDLNYNELDTLIHTKHLTNPKELNNSINELIKKKKKQV